MNEPERLLAEERSRVLIEESRELVVVLDAEERVLAASRRAREELPGVELGARMPEELLRDDGAHTPMLVPYDASGRRETLVYFGRPGDAAAYEELRAGFTAAVSHELRTPLARLLALLDSTELPGADVAALVDQARGEIEQIRELIDDVLFLGELETGKQVVALGSTLAAPVIEEVLREAEERAVRAAVSLRAELDAELYLPLRPRMLRTIMENLVENALRYAGPRATFRVVLRRDERGTVLEAADDGAGVPEEDLPRLFERFFRADRARASRGTGLGLAIVKHVVTSAGGTVEAEGGVGRGLAIRCIFPDRRHKSVT